MTHEDYMRQAIKLALKSEKMGGAPIGAVIVSINGDIIGEGVSLVVRDNDPTGHSEVIAIRQAAHELQEYNLNGCRLYSTCESCGMCLSAMAWANITEAYFGVAASDITDNLYELKDYSSIEYAVKTQTWNGNPVRVEGGILGDECRVLLDGYANWSKLVK